MQVDQHHHHHHHQQQHEAWNVSIQARARRKLYFAVEARIIPTTGKFQSFSILFWLPSFDFRFNLEPVPAIPITRQTLKSKFLKILKKSRISSWEKKISAPKKDVMIPANPLKKLAFKNTEKLSPCWQVLTGGCLAAAVYWASFHQGNMKFEGAYISQYVSEAFKFAGSIANEILCKWFKW
ncbi:hypothetical protein SLA2020_465490 [Shorea laevis]